MSFHKEERSTTERIKSARFFFNMDKNMYSLLAELLEILDGFWLRSFERIFC